jgi:hypothetical protein
MSPSDPTSANAVYISGEYTTWRDAGVRYAYAGSWWWEENHFVIWRIKVWQDSVLKGELDGRIVNPPKDHIRAVVRGMIEKSIESGAALGP